MNRFAPQTVANLQSYRKSLDERIEIGALNAEEAELLYDAARDKAFKNLRDDPKRLTVRCPDCNALAAVIGRVQLWRCPCSPLQERSAWDCRIEKTR